LKGLSPALFSFFNIFMGGAKDDPLRRTGEFSIWFFLVFSLVVFGMLKLNELGGFCVS